MARPTRDLQGLKFGMLVAIKMLPQKGHRGLIVWLTKCDCGTFRTATTAQLTNGNTKSCGCLRRRPVEKKHTPPAQKLCPHCNKVKPAAEYGQKPNGLLKSWCRECANELARKMRPKKEKPINFNITFDIPVLIPCKTYDGPRGGKSKTLRIRPRGQII